MVELEETREGILVGVQAQPRARRNGVVGEHAGRLKVAVTQAPEKGKANDAIQKVLAAALDLKRSQVRLTSGPISSQKTFLITGISISELRQRIDSLGAT